MEVLQPFMNVPVIVALGAMFLTIAYWYTQSKKGGIAGAKESNEILRSLNDDLKSAMVEQQQKHLQEVDAVKLAHDKEIKALQSQIDALQIQVKTLEQANKTLENTVTGREVLNEIQNSLSLFKPYITAFEQFVKSDREILSKLDELLKIAVER